MIEKCDAELLNFLSRLNFGAPAELGSGMDGTVYSLGQSGFIAKVWSGRTAAELIALQRFYQSIKNDSGELETPEVMEILLTGTRVVSVERRLRGTPLRNRFGVNEDRVPALAVTAIISCLNFLQSVGTDSLAVRMPVLNEKIRDHEPHWNQKIQKLFERRLALSQSLLLEFVPQLPDVIAATKSFLETRNAVRACVLHGDLYGGNIMVDEDGRATGLIDFGFLTMMGDPAFDASIASGIYNMYGSHARDNDDQLIEELVQSFAFTRDVLLCYRAVYALITAKAYSEKPSDGHFQWSVKALNQVEIRNALGIK